MWNSDLESHVVCSLSVHFVYWLEILALPQPAGFLFLLRLPFPSSFSYSACRSYQDPLPPCPCPFCHCKVYVSYFPSWFAAVPFSDVQCKCIWRQNPVWKTETPWKKGGVNPIFVSSVFTTVHRSIWFSYVPIHPPSLGFPAVGVLSTPLYLSCSWSSFVFWRDICCF